MKTPQLIFLSGLSGSGKGWFYDNCVQPGVFRKLKSMTTRPPRAGEVDGEHYYFVDEEKFWATSRATTLFVNEQFWKPGEPKWLYGVPESEFAPRAGGNLAYDVIEPKYIRQMIDWTNRRGLDYDIKILHFQPPKDNFETVAARANMTNDLAVRRTNTCDLLDFWNIGLEPDFRLSSSPAAIFFPVEMVDYFNALDSGEKFRMPENMSKKVFSGKEFWSMTTKGRGR